MIVYERRPDQDLLMARWWLTLTESGDIKTAFTEDCHSLAAFLAFHHWEGRSLVYEADEKGFWYVAWYAKYLSGVCMGMWIRADWRGRRDTLRATEEAMDLGLKMAPVLIGITCQERLLRTHERLGYTVLGMVPNLYDGRDAWIVILTRGDFERAKAMRRGLRHGNV